MRHDVIDVALGEYGIQELPGPKEHSPRIIQYFDEVGHSWVKNDELAWCSAFWNWVALQCGRERSGKLNARSWLDVGIPIENPERGDTVIFWRKEPDSPWGHVGGYIWDDGTNIWTLGGNQSNRVQISAYPKERVLGYRYLPKA